MPKIVLALLLVSFSTVTLAAEAVKVNMETSKGNIVLELYPDKAPKSVANFLKYAEDGFYNNTIFHRVIDNFMIQGGGFDKTYNRKPSRDAIKNEADNGLKNDRGTIAMARTPDPHSATAQFFINVKDNAFLNFSGKNSRGWGYAVFGKVVKGMEVVDAIKTTPTGRGGPFPQDVPREMIVITKVSKVSKEKAKPAKK